MSEDIFTSVLKEHGEILLIYIGNDETHLLFENENPKGLLYVRADQNNVSKEAVFLPVDKCFFKRSAVHFYKPTVVDDVISFRGLITISNEHYRFSISKNDYNLQSSSGLTASHVKKNSLLSCLDKIDLAHGLQLKNSYYFTGILKDNGEEHPVYGVANMLTNTLTRIYYLYSDAGEIIPSSISINHRDSLVYVTGKIEANGISTNLGKKNIPYIEQFLLRPEG